VVRAELRLRRQPVLRRLTTTTRQGLVCIGSRCEARRLIAYSAIRRITRRRLIIRIRKMRTVLLYYSFSLTLIYLWLFFTPLLPAQNQVLLIPGVILFSYLLIQHPKPFLTDTFIYVMIGIWITFVYNLYFS
jgi:hypothetical protein